MNNSQRRRPPRDPRHREKPYGEAHGNIPYGQQGRSNQGGSQHGKPHRYGEGRKYGQQPYGSSRRPDPHYYENFPPFEEDYPVKKNNEPDLRYGKRPSGAKRYEQYLEKSREREEKNARELEEQESKRDSINKGGGKLAPATAENTLKDDENPYLIAETDEVKANSKARLLKQCTVIAVCLLLSLLLTALSIHIPYTPSIIAIDFSAFPELLVCLSINPIAAVCVTVIKNLLFLLFNHTALPSVPGKIILDVIYILITYIIANAIKKSNRLKKRNDERESLGFETRDYTLRTFFAGGVIASAAAAMLSVPLLFAFNFPIMIKMNSLTDGYSLIYEQCLLAYEAAVHRFPFIAGIVPSLPTLVSAVAFYNLPLSLFKYGVCLIFALIAYPLADIFLNSKANENEIN